MTEWRKGYNANVKLPYDNDFSFYIIEINDKNSRMGLPLPVAQHMYQDMKNDFIYCMHGNRGISKLRYKYKNDHYYHNFIVCIQGENEVIFRMKYETARLLYTIPRSIVFDMYIDEE